MNLEWLESFEDPYLKRPGGQGVFLAGVALGMVAYAQAGSAAELKNTPLFKKLMFGRLQLRDLRRLLGELPNTLKAYPKADSAYNNQLLKAATDRLLHHTGDLGVDGNFAFTTAFMNAWKYYARTFNIQSQSSAPETTSEEQE